MNCRWCHASMPARKGKLFCSDKCRVSNARYETAWTNYLKALRHLETTHNKLLKERELLSHGT